MLKRQFHVSLGKDEGQDEILIFIIKSSSEIVALLNFIFNLNLLKGKFPRQAAVMPVFKKNYGASVINYRPVAIYIISPTFYSNLF
jgi:hypothetical protein